MNVMYRTCKYVVIKAPTYLFIYPYLSIYLCAGLRVCVCLFDFLWVCFENWKLYYGNQTCFSMLVLQPSFFICLFELWPGGREPVSEVGVGRCVCVRGEEIIRVVRVNFYM